MNRSFSVIFDKTNGDKTSSHDGLWMIKEQNNTHTKQLNLQVLSDGLSPYVEHVNESNFSIKSTHIEDKKCDGFAFVINHGKCDKLLFVELKDGLSGSSIVKALSQLFWSFVKMHSYLSMCSGYVLEDLSLEFVVATQNFANAEGRTRLEHFITRNISVPEKRETADFFYNLLKYGRVVLSMDRVLMIIGKQYPFNEKIVGKKVVIHHVVSANYGDSSVSAQI